MQKIILYPNAENDIDFSVTVKVAEELSKLGREVALSPATFDDSDIPIPKTNLPVSSLEDELPHAEMIITFGGDGTILRAARTAAGFGVPILGINMGGKGFMAELEPNETEKLKSVAVGDYNIETRMMIDISIHRDAERVYKGFALNDIVIKGDNKLIEMGILADGHKITHFQGDGAVIATPTGSTAYSMSAGGPIVEPTAKNIVITPICAHILEAKSFVLVASRVVSVEIDAKKTTPAYISVDGGKHISVMSGDLIEVRNSAKKTKLVRFDDSSFYHKISTKLASRLHSS